MLDDECACYDSSRTSASAAASSFSVAVKEENTSSGHTEASLGSSNNDTEEEGRFSLRTETSVERSECAQANDLFHPDRWNSLMDVIRRRNIVMVGGFSLIVSVYVMSWRRVTHPLVVVLPCSVLAG